MNRGRYAINLYDIMTLLTGYGYSTLSTVATTYERSMNHTSVIILITDAYYEPISIETTTYDRYNNYKARNFMRLKYSNICI